MFSSVSVLMQVSEPRDRLSSDGSGSSGSSSHVSDDSYSGLIDSRAAPRPSRNYGPYFRYDEVLPLATTAPNSDRNSSRNSPEREGSIDTHYKRAAPRTAISDSAANDSDPYRGGRPSYSSPEFDTFSGEPRSPTGNSEMGLLEAAWVTYPRLVVSSGSSTWITTPPRRLLTALII